MGKTGFDEFADHPEVFDIRPDPSGDWEVSYYRSLTGVDGGLLPDFGERLAVLGPHIPDGFR